MDVPRGDLKLRRWLFPAPENPDNKKGLQLRVRSKDSSQ